MQQVEAYPEPDDGFLNDDMISASTATSIERTVLSPQSVHRVMSVVFVFVLGCNEIFFVCIFYTGRTCLCTHAPRANGAAAVLFVCTVSMLLPISFVSFVVSVC
jgi:hypothetical protein